MLNELKNEDDKEMFSLIETENVEIKKDSVNFFRGNF